MSDNRDPLCYRGIALAPAASKLYCKLLNGRLSQWIDDNNGLADEQNGFRNDTIDQIASLTNIIDVRKKLHFVIDVRKKLHFVRLSILKRRMIQLIGICYGENLPLLVLIQKCVLLLNLCIMVLNVQSESIALILTGSL